MPVLMSFVHCQLPIINNYHDILIIILTAANSVPQSLRQCTNSFFNDYNIGPVFITRKVNDANEFIPCPFSGPNSPVWIINGYRYESFNVPQEYIPFPYGLLIPRITHDLNGTTFQCLVSNRYQPGYLPSSTGILIVKH